MSISHNRIYVTGCARSGTTLLKRLFYAFEDVEIIRSEIKLSDFIKEKFNTKYIVGKRWTETIFSDIANPEKIKEDIDCIRENDIFIVNIYRDGRDVIEGVMDTGKRVSAKRWIETIRQMFRYGHLINCLITYELLVTSPNLVQNYIAHKFNLKPKKKFSDYPDFVPNTDFAAVRDHSYKPRRISTDRIGKDLDLYKTLYPDDIQEFEKYLEILGYAKF